MVGIYTITSPTDKVYVGQSWDIDRRLDDYLKLQCADQFRIYNSLKKHGVDKHKFEIAIELRDDISQATLNCWEAYFYNLFKANHEMMNLIIPDEDGGGKHSEETKKRISEARKGKRRGPLSEAWKANLKKARNTPENIKRQKEKIGVKSGFAISIVQFTKTGEFIRKWDCAADVERALGIKATNIARCCKNKARHTHGYIWQYESSADVHSVLNKLNTPPPSGIHSPVYGRKHTDEAKAKMSAFQKGKIINEKQKEALRIGRIKRESGNYPQSKKVNQYDKQGNFIKEWGSAADASRFLGKHISLVRKCANGQTNTAGGFIWKYKEKEVTCQ